MRCFTCSSPTLKKNHCYQQMHSKSCCQTAIHIVYTRRKNPSRHFNKQAKTGANFLLTKIRQAERTTLFAPVQKKRFVCHVQNSNDCIQRRPCTRTQPYPEHDGILSFKSSSIKDTCYYNCAFSMFRAFYEQIIILLESLAFTRRAKV